MAESRDLEEKKLKLEEKKLQIQKYGLCISISTPIFICLLGAWIQSSIKTAEQSWVTREKEREQVWRINEQKREQAWKTSERRAEQRAQVYANIGPSLNIIYCYVDDVGDYTRYSPVDIINKKREVDRIFFAYYSYWSLNTKTAYRTFMDGSFATYQGVATDAKIKSSSFQKKAAYQKRMITWDLAWSDSFTEEKSKLLRDSYLELVISFLTDLQANDELNRDNPPTT